MVTFSALQEAAKYHLLPLRGQREERPEKRVPPARGDFVELKGRAQPAVQNLPRSGILSA